jgi:hypothetical protein
MAMAMVTPMEEGDRRCPRNSLLRPTNRTAGRSRRRRGGKVPTHEVRGMVGDRERGAVGRSTEEGEFVDFVCDTQQGRTSHFPFIPIPFFSRSSKPNCRRYLCIYTHLSSIIYTMARTWICQTRPPLMRRMRRGQRLDTPPPSTTAAQKGTKSTWYIPPNPNQLTNDKYNTNVELHSTEKQMTRGRQT